MNCNRLNELLPLYLSGELQGEEWVLAQRHLQNCQHCAAAVYADRELDNALRAAMLEELPDVSPLLRRVQAEMAAPWWKRIPHLVPMRVLGVAAAIIVLALISLPWLYLHQAQKSMALEAADDHYNDLVLLRHPDWDYQPADVARFIEQQFPQKQDLLRSITPKNASLEKVRLCNLRGTPYAHFVFKTGAVETSVFLRADTGSRRDRAAHLSDGGHGLEVAGFSSSGLAGIVVGPLGQVQTQAIANHLANTL
jgi:anti-sigma factor RsiW